MTVCAPALLARTLARTAATAAAAFVLTGAGRAAAAPSVPSPVDEPGTATICVDETHRWGGDVTLAGPGSLFDTGIEVPPAAGSQVSVVGLSADGLDATDRAHVLAVRVGDVPATIGAAVLGGSIIVASNVDAAVGEVRVVGVTVLVRRCDTVASAAAAPPTGGASGSVGDGSGSAVIGSVLPSTGGTPWRQSVIGALLVAIGCGLISLGRRTAASPGTQVTAGGREPGSPLGEQRPARG